MSDTVSLQAAPRDALIARLEQDRRYDLAVVGGGATGLGVALDAAARGLSVALVESHDFAKGTSSRSTKLVHGGVRYLAQGDVALVREALHERATLIRNAPHLARPLAFLMPAYAWWERPFYGAGLKLYDLMAGRAGLGPTRFWSRAHTLRRLPTLRSEGLRGAIEYWDGQFDDARLALALARTAAARGALAVNYCAATGLLYENGKVAGLHCEDRETGRRHTVRAGCVVNAAGVWVDELRAQDGQALGMATRPLVAPSQGVHLVVDREFWPADHALLVPRTTDGRVLFAVPWLGKTVLGTTDTPRHDLAREPLPFAQEIRFILGESGRYLRRAPTPADVRSVWVGLRPLVRPADGDDAETQRLSREHTVSISRSGLVTVTGGKWTTYRAMAEDVVGHCVSAGLLRNAGPCATATLPLAGSPRPRTPAVALSRPPGLHEYGSDAETLRLLPGADRELTRGLTEATVRFAARYEYARTVEDVLARRFRLLFLDAAEAARQAGEVARILHEETGRDPQEEAFRELARQYTTLPDGAA